MKIQTLNDLGMAIREVDRVSDLWQISIAFVSERGIQRIIYHSNEAQTGGSAALGLVAHGFPERWLREYESGELYRNDPLPRLAARRSRPFRWSEAPGLEKLDDASLSFLNMLSRSGLGDGLAMQVYGPNMRNAYVGMGFGSEDPDLSEAEVFELQCSAQIVHLRYCELTEDRQAKTESLSPREIEILYWIARGKSSTVIAEILGISGHTVDTITRRIFAKLGVNDRTTAALRAVDLGIVRVRD